MISRIALLLCLAGPATAQDLVFDIWHSKTCVSGGGGADCIGMAADRCMSDTPGGHSTYGMGGCLSAELDWWDAELNRAYQELRAAEKTIDQDEAEWLPAEAPKRAVALRDAQRAWITFRDATCLYEQTQWGGGTGGGPAYVGCLLRMTGEQTLYLKSMQGG